MKFFDDATDGVFDNLIVEEIDEVQLCDVFRYFPEYTNQKPMITFSTNDGNLSRRLLLFYEDKMLYIKKEAPLRSNKILPSLVHVPYKLISGVRFHSSNESNGTDSRIWIYLEGNEELFALHGSISFDKLGIIFLKANIPFRIKSIYYK